MLHCSYGFQHTPFGILNSFDKKFLEVHDNPDLHIPEAVLKKF